MAAISTDALRIAVEPASRASRLAFECVRPFQVALVYPQYIAPQVQPIELIGDLYCADVILWTGSHLQVNVDGHTFEIKEVQ